MPKAGWCRECGEWIWVDPEGGCQNGHGSECVGGIYDAEEKPTMSTNSNIDDPAPAFDFGVGDFPRSLDRFSWAAFLLPLPWAVGYGAWSVLTLWTLMALIPFVLVALVGSFGEEAVAANIMAINIVSEVAGGAIRLWIGANATRMLWTRERLRVEMIESAQPRFSITKYVSRQRVWVWVGVMITALSVAGLVLIAFSSDPVVVQFRDQASLEPRDAVLSGFWLIAQALLGLWLATKMREESAAPPLTPPGE